MKNWAYWTVRLFGPAHSLGRRITVYTIAFSSVIMLVISVAQLGVEYRDLRTSLDKELDGIEVFVPNLSGSVWSFDQKQIQLALDGLKRLPNINYLRVTTVEGGQEWASGSLPASNALSRNFDLAIAVKGKNTVIGQLTVVASLDEINQHIFDSALTILLSNGLKSFLVALFSLFLFRHLIARRLEKMTGNLRALTPLVFPASAETEMPVQSSPERSDELDVVEWTLSRTANDLKRASVELGQHRDHLQTLVEKSTHELRMQNEELRQARDALDASRARYVDLYELAPVGYCSVNEAGLITQANLALATLLGVAHSALAWKPLFSNFVLPQDQSSWYKLRPLLLETGAPQTCELRLRQTIASDGGGEVGGSGASVWVQLAITVAQDDAGAQQLLIAVSDISERKQSEAAREDALSLLKGTTDRVPGVVYQYKLRPDGSSCFPFTSEAIREIYRVTPEEVRQDASRVFSILHPDDYDAVAVSIQQSARDTTPWVHEYRVKFDDGTVRWLRGDALPKRESDGCVLWHGFITDITEQKHAQTELQLAANVFSHSREGITITDAQGTIIDVNEAFTRITGYSREEALGQNPRILSSGRQDKAFYEALWRGLTEQGHWSGEMWNRRKSGEVYAELVTISAVSDAHGRTQHYVALFSDITAIKAHQSTLEHIAHFDALTSLPNRLLLADRLQQAMAQAQRRGQQLAVAYLDLDGFKSVNDSHGHALGDQLLVTLATAMKDALREGDTLARIGGDEFVAVLIDLDSIDSCVPMLTRLLEAAAALVQLGEVVLQGSASIGVTFYPQAGDVAADQLLRQADQAMYQAKMAGKNRYQIFDAAQDSSLRVHHESLERIRLALVQGEFVLHYQPKVNMRSGQVIGAEALIRWQHPEKGLLAPAMFLPVIEDHPLAVAVGEWVIDTALTQVERWHAAGLDLPASVNIGARQLQQANFVQQLQAILAKHPQVNPASLQLEVLETSALADMAQVSQVIEDCAKIGVKFALDDFGTGYSSLTYLKRLRVTLLKIDQSFVRDMLDDPDDLAILQGVIGLAAAFKREVIAEGVETVAHGTALLQLGCELAQGYGIARPMPPDQIPAWAATWQPDAAWCAVPNSGEASRSTEV